MATRSFAVVLLASAGLAGCSTQAQEQFAADNKIFSDVRRQGSACQVAANENPEFSILWAHTPKAGDQPDLPQMADVSMLTPEQRAPFLAWRTAETSCRPIFNQLGGADVNLLFSLRSGWSDADAVRVRLLAQQIPWGEANSEIQAISSKTDAAVGKETQSLVAELREENAEEVQQRAAAVQAFGEAMRQEQQVLQQQQAAQQQQMQHQQLLNAVNRPVSTNCNTYGSQTNCTSY
jgi:hypothetical protein